VPGSPETTMTSTTARFTIGRKLAAGFGLMMALMLFSATFAYTKMVKATGLQDTIRNFRYPATVDAAKIQAAIGEAGGPCAPTFCSEAIRRMRNTSRPCAPRRGEPPNPPQRI
jgi:hypothetical protein